MPRLDEVSEWLQKASNDLRSARILVEHDPPVPDTAAFHSQQAVEKALKAFLVWRGVRFEKVHSLTYLMDICEAQEAEFASFRTQAEDLAPFSVEIRYPSDCVEISIDDALFALKSAQEVCKFVMERLPTDLHSSAFICGPNLES